MKAPDKIYLHPDFEGSQTPSVFWGEEKRGSHPEECVEYIRKEALLEWAERHNCEQGFEDGETEHGYRVAIRDLVSKLNSM